MAIARLLGVAASLEAATGLALMIHPPLVVRLLLGADLSGPGVALGRVAGFGLLSLGVACWPGPAAADGKSPVLRAMFIYNLLVTTYLVYLGVDGRWVGRLLWPAVVIHAVVTLLFVRAWAKD